MACTPKRKFVFYFHRVYKSCYVTSEAEVVLLFVSRAEAIANGASQFLKATAGEWGRCLFVANQVC